MTYARIGKYSATAPTLSDGETTFLRTNANGDLVAVLSGSNLELYGAGIGDRPAANTVTVGTIYEDVTAQVFYQSDGTNWVVM